MANFASLLARELPSYVKILMGLMAIISVNKDTNMQTFKVSPLVMLFAGLHAKLVLLRVAVIQARQ